MLVKYCFEDKARYAKNVLTRKRNIMQTVSWMNERETIMKNKQSFKNKKSPKKQKAAAKKAKRKSKK